LVAMDVLSCNAFHELLNLDVADMVHIGYCSK
jgi:hypothetical protein